MKQTITLLVTALLMMAGVQTAQAQKMKIYFTSGEPVGYDIQKIDHIEFEESEPVVEPEYVDLGLPSGTLWATTNIGASDPEEVGDFYAWGETETKDTYSWATYQLCNGSYLTMNKYCTDEYYGTVDGLKSLKPADDAATTLYGDGWSIPTKEQFEELVNETYTTCNRTTQNGVEGLKVTSQTTGKSIFLPIGGYRDGTSSYDTNRGFYWTKDLYGGIDNLARSFSVDVDSYSAWDSKSRRCGLNIRPVRAHVAPPTYNLCPDDNHPHAIDLYLKSGTKWACCNVGANSPEDVGYYFAWGETEPKTTYTENNYFIRWNEVSSHDELKPEYDAATANMGSPWHMPSYEQLEELQQRCRAVEWTEINGVKGVIIAKKLFLPVSGRYDGDELDYPYTPTFWTSTIYSSERTPNMPNPSWGGAYIPSFYLGESAWDITHLPFYLGLPIRAVCE